jgi:peptidoglycan/LPS O-acetylase OafA/YrhL
MVEGVKSDIEIAPRRREMAGVDLLRFSAAGMVMLFHLGFWGCAAPHTRTNSLVEVHACYPKLAPFASVGWVGVEIFFVISGFVIAWSAQNASTISFVRSRFLRLAPAAWICATLTVGAVLAFTGAQGRDLARPYLRTLAFYPTAPWVDDAYWTLGIEIAFYAVVAAALASGRRGWIPAVVGVVGATSAAFWLLRAAAGWSGVSPLAAVLDAAAKSRYSELALVQHGCFFCIGAVFCAAMGGRPSRRVLALAACCGVGGALEIAASSAQKAALTGYAVPAAAPVAVWAVAMLVIAASIRYERVPAGAPLAALARRVGLMTYPLYLVHTLIGSISIQAMIGLGIGADLALALSAACAVALAFVVSEGLEPAARRVLLRGLSRGLERPDGAARHGGGTPPEASGSAPASATRYGDLA